MKAYVTPRKTPEGRNDLTDWFDVGIILILREEYELALPALSAHLQDKRAKKSSDAGTVSEVRAIDERIQEVTEFVAKLEVVRQDLGRSFSLTPSESEAVVDLLACGSWTDQDSLSPPVQQSSIMAATINMHLGRAWGSIMRPQLDAFDAAWRRGEIRPEYGDPDYVDGLPACNYCSLIEPDVERAIF